MSTRIRLRVTHDELAVLAAMVEHTTALRNADLAATVTRRLAAPTRDTCPHPDLAGGKPTRLRPCPTCRGGYATRAERHAKRRRRDVLTARLDASGNPVGKPVTIPLVTSGPVSLRDARLREAVTALLVFARERGAGTIVVEDLDFTDPTTRERTGRGRRAKAFRRIVAGIPTGARRTRLVRMAARQGVTVVAVDPAIPLSTAGRRGAGS